MVNNVFGQFCFKSALATTSSGKSGKASVIPPTLQAVHQAQRFLFGRMTDDTYRLFAQIVQLLGISYIWIRAESRM
ncbi:MAG: hypothetical protein AAF433_19885 [Bacteroidota bacterium]